MDNLDELSNLVFIYNKRILGGACHTVIISLFHELISMNKLVHNFELSQHFALNKSFMDYGTCHKCEIVLRYSKTVCPNPPAINQMGGIADKYYFAKKNTEHLEDKSSGIDNNKNVSFNACGMIELFIKKSSEETNGTKIIQYSKIDVVKLVDIIDININLKYLDIDSVSNVKNIADIAICRGVTDALNAANIDNNIETTNKIISESIESIPKIQSEKFKKLPEIFISHPSQYTVNLAKSITNFIKTMEKTNNICILILPNNPINIAQHLIIMPSISIRIESINHIPQMRIPSAKISQLNKNIFILTAEQTTIPSYNMTDVNNIVEKGACYKCEKINAIVDNITKKN
jgi:hypothetical protein